MVDMKKVKLGAGAALCLALGAAGGAGVVGMTRPPVEMAPASPVAIASLMQHDGIVTVKGKVAEVYGDRLILADGSGRTMVALGHDAPTIAAGAALTVQGRYDDGQLRASFLVDQSGNVSTVGPRPGFRHKMRDFHDRFDRHDHDGPDRDDMPPPPPPVAPIAPPATSAK